MALMLTQAHLATDGACNAFWSALVLSLDLLDTKYLFSHVETERETRGAFHSTQISENISVDTSNGTDHFGLVRPVIHFERSGHFGLLGFPLSPVPLFCMLLKRTTTKRVVAWAGSVQPKCTVSLGKWNFPKFKTGIIFVEWKTFAKTRSCCVEEPNSLWRSAW